MNEGKIKFGLANVYSVSHTNAALFDDAIMDAEKWTRSVGRAVLLLAQAVTAQKTYFNRGTRRKAQG